MARNDAFGRLLNAVRGIQTDLAVSAAFVTPDTIREPDLEELTSPTVFISWAHSHSSWTKKQASAWQEGVATLASTLRQSFGIDADIDLFHLHEPVDWTRFGQRGIVNNERVVVVLSEAWAERWEGTNSPTEGAGAAREADALHGLFSRNQDDWQNKLMVVMLPDVSDDHLPVDLDRVARVKLDPSNPDSYESLVRNLTGQPQYVKVPLGTVPDLPPLNSVRNLAALRAQLEVVRAQRRVAAKNRTPEGGTLLHQLELQEAALRGFIETALQEND